MACAPPMAYTSSTPATAAAARVTGVTDPVARSGGTHTIDLGDAGDLGRHGRHQQRRGVRRPAARHVAADPADRLAVGADDHAVLVVVGPRTASGRGGGPAMRSRASSRAATTSGGVESSAAAIALGRDPQRRRRRRRRTSSSTRRAPRHHGRRHRRGSPGPRRPARRHRPTAAAGDREVGDAAQVQSVQHGGHGTDGPASEQIAPGERASGGARLGP